MSRRARWLHPASLSIVLVAALVVPLPFFAESPGTLLSLASCVAVDDPAAGPVDGDYLVTTVHRTQASIGGLLLAGVRDDTRLVPVQRVVPRDATPEDFFRADRARFLSTAERASAVGLRAAGIDARVDGDGALVVGVVPGLPAEGVLREGDVIVGVDGATIGTDTDLQEAVRSGGGTVAVDRLRDGDRATVQLRPVLDERDGRSRRVIGVQVQTLHPSVELPVPVTVGSGQIGGPSGGLMIALTVFDAVDDVDLAAGRRIAGTGQIDVDGAVGSVGSVDLKVVAAAAEGAAVFLVPTAQEATARRALPPDSPMQVIGVDTLDEAIDALRTGVAEGPQVLPAAVRTCDPGSGGAR